MSRQQKRRRGKASNTARPHSERWWGVDDALREYVRLIDWFGTQDAVRAAYLAYYTNYRGRWPDGLTDPDQQWELADGTARATAATLAAGDPMWCDPAMVDLIAGAADTYPPEPFLEHHLLAPNGMVIFAKPMPAVWLDPKTGEGPSALLSAISWASGMSTEGQPVLGIAGWKRHNGVVRHTSPDLTINYPGLRLVSYALGLYGAPLENPEGPAETNRILQTFSALCRTPLVGHETTTEAKAARQRPVRAGRRDPAIRRVYLRRPESGPAELSAAQAERNGLPRRGHWVRGHWKQQWFASIEEHRSLWIEGYPRGDFSQGEIAGTKVLIATGNADVAAESSGSATSPPE